MSTDAAKLARHPQRNLLDVQRFRDPEERQRFLYEVSDILVSSLDHQITLQEIAQLIVPYLADYSRIAIIDERQTIREITASHVNPEKVALVRALFEEYKDRSSTTHGIQKILQTGEPELISTVSDSVLATVQDNPELQHIVQELELKSYMGVPLIARGKMIGAITFSSIQPERTYTEEDLRFAQEVARRIALTVDNAQLYKQVQESQQHLQYTMNNAPIVLWSVNTRGIFTLSKGRALESLGLKSDEVVGQSHFELYKDLPAVVACVKRALQGETFTESVEIQGRWFETFYMPIRDDDGTITGMAGVSTDITERKHAEEERNRWLVREQAARADLEKQQQWLETILNLLPTPLLVIEPGTARVTFANKAADELAGGKFPTGVPGEEYDAVYICYDAEGNRIPNEQMPGVRVARGERLQNFQMDWETPAGRRSLLLDADILPPMYGHPKTALVMFQDITELKALEKRKDEFISMASHELKTPVTSIKGFTQLLQRRFRQRDDVQSLQFLDRMDGQLNKLTKLISDLLDISRMQTGKLEYREEYFDLEALVQEIIENLQGTAQTHQIQFESQSYAPVFADRDRVGQVLINLLTNAIKYSPNADTVIVRVSAEPENACVSVQDFGIGISKAHQEKIFERFYQVTEPLEKTYPGLGIGLYISSEIIKRHGGRIWVESQKGQGATFNFSLPLAMPAPTNQ